MTSTAFLCAKCGAKLRIEIHASYEPVRLFGALEEAARSLGWRRIGHEATNASWTEVAWASTSSAASRSKERIWFSPHCKAAMAQVEMFAGVGVV